MKRLLVALLLLSAPAFANEPCAEVEAAVSSGEKVELNWKFPDNSSMLDRVIGLYGEEFEIIDENDVEIAESVASYSGPTLVGYVVKVYDVTESFPTISYSFDSERKLLKKTSLGGDGEEKWFCEGYRK
jgi:hypothetical protein